MVGERRGFAERGRIRRAASPDSRQLAARPTYSAVRSISCRGRADPISYFQAVILGLTQGIAEPFPISSLGHGVVLPRLAGWHIHQNDKFFLTFLIATHLGDGDRAAAVLPARTGCGSSRASGARCRCARSAPMTPTRGSAGCSWRRRSPSGIIGLLLQDPLRKLFASPQTAAAFLIVNGVALLAFERLRRRPPRARRLSRRRPMDAWPSSAGARRSASAPRRRPRWSPASRARASRWAAACSPGSPTRMPRASASCSRRR